MNQMRYIGEILQELRKDNKLKQKDIAEKLNISVSTVSHYESGVNVPDIFMVIKLADLFGVSVDYLLGRSRIRIDFDIFKKQVHFSDGSTMSLEELGMLFINLSEQSQGDLIKLMKLYKLRDDLRHTALSKGDDRKNRRKTSSNEEIHQ